MLDTKNRLPVHTPWQYCGKVDSQLYPHAKGSSANFVLLLQEESDFVSEWLLQLQPNVTNILTAGVGVTVFHRPVWVWEGSLEPFKFTKWWPGKSHFFNCINLIFTLHSRVLSFAVGTVRFGLYM
jgi:hypothetical protein